MQCNGKTDVGLLRKENQDTFLIKKIGNSVLGVVCDGMGGMEQGDMAASLAAKAYSSYIELELPQITDANDIPGMLRVAANKANEAVFNYSVKTGVGGMGTTLVSFLKTASALYVLNLGDSRCYKMLGNELIRVTKDHSFVQELVDIGIITADEATDHPENNIVTKAVGVELQIEPDVFTETKYDAVLLCSDGLSKCVEEDEIKKLLLSDADTKRICDALVEAAKAGGGTDNITVVVMK